jgi:hypothetical protein
MRPTTFLFASLVTAFSLPALAQAPLKLVGIHLSAGEEIAVRKRRLFAERLESRKRLISSEGWHARQPFIISHRSPHLC